MAKKTFEEIKPWDGTSGTGREAREALKANFDKVNEGFDEIDASFKGIYDIKHTLDIETSNRTNADLNLQSQVSALGNGAPKGPPYANLEDLNAGNPDHSFNYITLDNGNWNYWNGSSFVSGGSYLSSTNLSMVEMAPLTNYILHKDKNGIIRSIDIYPFTSITDHGDPNQVGSIEWAINQLGANGGTLNCYAGYYPILRSILIDWDWIDIEGVSEPFWSGPGTAYPIPQLPGEPGGCQIVATTAINMFTIGDTVANMHGAARHKGITINKINGFGSYVALSFITNSTLGQTDDNVHITRNMIQGFTDYAIIEGWDTNYIDGNQIQSNLGGGILRTGGYTGWITNNVIYDNGGAAITVTTALNDTIFGNKVGSGVAGETPPEIILNGGSGVVFGNILYANSPPISNAGGIWLIYGNYGGNETRNPFQIGVSPIGNFSRAIVADINSPVDGEYDAPTVGIRRNGVANPQTLALWVNQADSYSAIQSTKDQVSATDLKLNPSGGRVITGDNHIVDGKLGVGSGINEPASKFEVIDTLKNDLLYNAGIMTSDAMGADIGGKFSLGGRYSTTDEIKTPFGSIVGRKENSSDNNGDGYLALMTSNSNTSPFEKEWLRITSRGRVKLGSSIKIGDDTDVASVDNEFTIRTRKDANNSYLEMCMQTGVSTYAWVIVKQNTW